MHDLGSLTSDAVSVVVTGSATQVSHTLQEGESAMVGSSAGCQLRITDQAVAPHQCLLELRDGTVWLHNWADDGTCVNGEAIKEEVALEASDCVEIAGYRVSLLAGGSHDVSGTAAQAYAEPEGELREEAYLAPETDATVEHSVAPSYEASHDTGDEYEAPAATKQDPAQAESASTPEPAPPPSVEDATVSLLHSEIVSLQRELEERELLIAQLKKKTQGQKDESGGSSPAASKKIDALLQELQVTDSRVSDLESELTALEELRAAELTEKAHLDSWVNDIERRIAIKEGEAEAELETLRSRLQSEKHARVATQEKADQELRSDDVSAELHDTLVVLRRDHEALREKYQDALDKQSELQKECAELRESTDEAAIEARIAEALRLERLQISQERAAISRKEHDINRKLKQIETQLDIEGQARKNTDSDPDERFRAFRQRLKELHEEEKEEYVAPSIGKRLVKLWQRLDGPTDRD